MLLLPHAYLLPADRLVGDAAYLAASGADPATADPRRLATIAESLAAAVSADEAAAMAAAAGRLAVSGPADGPLRDQPQPSAGPSAAEPATNGESRGPVTAAAQRPEPAPPPGPPPSVQPRPRPASLSEASILPAVSEFRSFLSEAAQDRLTELGKRIAESPAAGDWAALSALCGESAAVIAGQLTTLRQQLRLWQVAWWALQAERRSGTPERIADRLAQVGLVLATYPQRVWEGLIAAYLHDFRALVTAYARRPFLEWLAGTLRETAEAELVQLSVLAGARLDELPEPDAGPEPQTAQEPPPQPGPDREPASSPARPVSLDTLPELVAEAWHGGLTHAEAIATVESGWFLLDTKREAENRHKLDMARAVGNGGEMVAPVALGAVRSALWRCRNLEVSGGDAVTLDQLGTVARLSRVVSEYRHKDRVAVIRELTSVIALTVLLRELVPPGGYTSLIGRIARVVPEDKFQGAVYGAGTAELLAYLNRDAVRGIIQRSPEPWVEATAEWVGRYERADLKQLLDIFREAGAQDSLAMHALLQSAAPPDDDSIFGPSDAAAFEQYYQSGDKSAIAGLLRKSQNHRRLLALADRDLVSEDHTEFLPPAGRAYVRSRNTGNQNIFSEVASKARSGDPADALEAHAAFDRALRDERRDDARRILTEWKAYALFRGRSILEAEPVWRAAAEAGTAAKEVLWNLAVLEKQQGTSWRGLQYLLPGIAAKTLPLSYMRFGCALAVATLRQADYDEEEPERKDGHEDGADPHPEVRAARQFIVDYGRVLPIASMHLLWFWLASADPLGSLDNSAGTALVTYTTLRAQPYDLPDPAAVARLAGEERKLTSDRVSSTLERLNDPHFRLTWRLWISEYALRTHWVWPAWEQWATACDADGDPGAAIAVLRQAAQAAVNSLNGRHVTEREREARSKFLRNVVGGLLRPRDIDRSALLEEIRDRYVLPVPELRDASRKENAQLLRRLGLTSTDNNNDDKPPPPGRAEVWPALYQELADVNTADDLGDPLLDRIQKAAQLDPGATGRHGQTVEALLALLADLAALRGGVPTDRVSMVLLKLSERASTLHGLIQAARLHQLIAPVRMIQRVLKKTSDALNAAPAPAIRLAPGWVGWPADHGTSSLPIEVSFPGPGSATSLRIVAGWDNGAEYRPQAEVRTVLDIAAGESAAYALALPRPDDLEPDGGTLRVRIDVAYAWGPANSLSTSVTLDAPACVFSEFLAERGIAGHEFPNPFTVDVPLTTEQVQGELFQGREQQLAIVRESYTPDAFPPLPLCFYGIRKTGKTSLLHRVAVEVTKAGLIGLEVSIEGVRADTHTADQIMIRLLQAIWRASVSAGAAPAPRQVPDAHPNPALLVEDFFQQVGAAFGDRPVVVMLDEFQFLLSGPNGEPVLDALRPIHESKAIKVGFIAFANQGLDPMNKTTSQLGLRSLRVDFLRQPDVERFIGNPLAELGVIVHPSAHRYIYEQAAGHPNFSAWLARASLGRLNLDHRNVLTISDIDASVEEILLYSTAFRLSWFSKHNISTVEEDAAIRLAKADDGYSGLDVTQLDTRLEMTTAIAIDLEAKRVAEFRQKPHPNLRIRGRLLWEFLRRQVSVGEVPPPPLGSADRVGLYVDLENLRPHKPSTMSYGELGRGLIAYAASLGDLKARYIAIASHNTGPDWARVQAELNAAGFVISHEPPEFSPQRRSEKRDIADFLMVQHIPEEVRELGLTRVVLVTGDGDLLILVSKLLKDNVFVRLVSGDSRSRSGDYLALADERRTAAARQGLQPHEADFDTLLLRDLLS